MTIFRNIKLGFSVTPVSEMQTTRQIASIQWLRKFLQTTNAFLIKISRKIGLDHQTLSGAADVRCAFKIIKFKILG
jgi:hypothetical protein